MGPKGVKESGREERMRKSGGHCLSSGYAVQPPSQAIWSSGRVKACSSSTRRSVCGGERPILMPPLAGRLSQML